MPLLAVFALGVGLICAFAVAAFVRSSLVEAQKHENRLLPFLHIFWIVTIVGFAAQLPFLLH